MTSRAARYVRFLAALYRAGSDWFPVLADAFAPRRRIGPVLALATPDLDDVQRARRLDLASETMLRMLADADRYGGSLDDDGYRDEVTAVFTAILTAPTRRLEAP